MAPPHDTIAQTLAQKRMSTAQTPNYVIYSQWQQAILRCFGFTFLYWKEVETHHPYFLKSMIHAK